MDCCLNTNKQLEKPVPTGVKPYNQRSCTDILFTLLFIASFAGVVVLISQASKDGANPQRIIRGVDYLGRICGVDNNVTQLPYTAWSFIPVTPQQDMQANGITSELYHIKICIDTCSSTQSNTAAPYPGLISSYGSNSFLYYCIPEWSSLSQNTSIDIQVTYSGEFQAASNVAAQNIAALMTTWPVILIAAFASILISYLYIYASRVLTGVFVWVTILLLSGGGCMLSYALLIDAYHIQSHTTSDLYNRAIILKGIGYTFLGITAIFVLIVFALRNRIRIAVEIVKEAAHSMIHLLVLNIVNLLLIHMILIKHILYNMVVLQHVIRNLADYVVLWNGLYSQE